MICTSLLDYIDDNPISRIPNSVYKNIEMIKNEIMHQLNIQANTSYGKTNIHSINKAEKKIIIRAGNITNPNEARREYSVPPGKRKRQRENVDKNILTQESASMNLRRTNEESKVFNKGTFLPSIHKVPQILITTGPNKSYMKLKKPRTLKSQQELHNSPIKR